MDVQTHWLVPSPPTECAMCGLRITDELAIRQFQSPSLDPTIPVAHFYCWEHYEWWFKSL
jgi:hypothetical protein